MVSKFLGTQYLLELYDCEREKIATLDYVKETLLEAATVAQSTIVDATFHQFSPYGVSGVVVIKESHIAIHTWPEHCFASIDFYTCNNALKIDDACTYLFSAFSAQSSDLVKIKRGKLNRFEK